MSISSIKNDLLKRIVLRAARWPIIYLTIGIILIALSYMDDLFPIIPWKNIFILTDKLGNIFIAVAIIIFIYNLFYFICLHYEKKLNQRNKTLSLIVASVRSSARIIFLLVTIKIIITIAAPSKYYLTFANSIITTVLIASIGWIAIQVLYTIESMLHHHIMTLSHKDQRAKALYTKMHIIRNIGTVVVIIITVAAILMSFSSVRNIGISLLASAGFLTAIVGLSAQKTLISLFSGLQIALAQPIKMGDIVVVGKESGIVEEITFTYVTLKLGDRRRLVVPISYFIDNPFENWSHDSRSLRSSFILHVDHMMPMEPLRQKLDEILDQSTYWDGVAKKLQVAHFSHQSIEVRIQVSAANADDLSDLKTEVREKILEFMQKNYPDYFPKIRHQNFIPYEIGKD